MTIGAETEVADALKPLWQCVEEKAANELIGSERHHTRFFTAVAAAARPLTRCVRSPLPSTGCRGASVTTLVWLLWAWSLLYPLHPCFSDPHDRHREAAIFGIRFNSDFQ
jgi:hypothetical protein